MADEKRQSTGGGEPKATGERERSDTALNLQRKVEDTVRTKERFQRRLIAEALLDHERKETDLHLLDERADIDLRTELNLALLTDEKSSHDQTKTALVSRNQFLAVVSHDLRNPLSSISMSAALMRECLDETGGDFKEPFKYLEIIERNAANMERMVSDLLDVERISNGNLKVQPTMGNVNELLDECLNLFKPILETKKFTMTVRRPEQKVLASFDHDRILQVLSNLIANAIKFTPKNGKIVLSADEKDNAVEISVADNGPGIPAGKLAQIFDRFSQLVSNDRRGLGLGLFISKWIVEAHGGKIWATSRADEGSQFHFVIPASQAVSV